MGTVYLRRWLLKTSREKAMVLQKGFPSGNTKGKTSSVVLIWRQSSRGQSFGDNPPAQIYQNFLVVIFLRRILLEERIILGVILRKDFPGGNLPGGNFPVTKSTKTKKLPSHNKQITDSFLCFYCSTNK